MVVLFPEKVCKAWNTEQNNSWALTNQLFQNDAKDFSKLVLISGQIRQRTKFKSKGILIAFVRRRRRRRVAVDERNQGRGLRRSVSGIGRHWRPLDAIQGWLVGVAAHLLTRIGGLRTRMGPGCVLSSFRGYCCSWCCCCCCGWSRYCCSWCCSWCCCCCSSRTRKNKTFKNKYFSTTRKKRDNRLASLSLSQLGRVWKRLP